MSMKISKRDAGLLLILAGMAIFLLMYLLVFNGLQAKSDALAQEIETTKPELQKLEDEYLNLATYQSGIEDYRKTVADKLEAFPSDVKEEDMVSYLLTMEADQKINIDSVSFSGTTQLLQFPGTFFKNNQDNTVDMTAGSFDTVFTGTLTYPQLKSVLDYLYSTKTQSAVNSVAVNYNSETGGLTGSFDISRFYVNWTDADYNPEPLPNSPTGVKDLFGTISAPAEEKP